MKDPGGVIQNLDLKSEKEKAYCRRPTVQVSIILAPRDSEKGTVKKAKMGLAPDP